MAQYSTPVQTHDMHTCWIQRVAKEVSTADRFQRIVSTSMHS